MATPRVAAIIPTYNSALFLGQAIESVLAQTYRQIETIVVDDGSTDGTQELLRRYEGRIKIITQQNQGVGAARNAGVSATNANYLAFLDADDLWLPNKIERQVAIFRAHPEVVLVSTGCKTIDSNGNPLQSTRPPRHLLDRTIGLYSRLLKYGNCIAMPSVMVRRDAFEAAGCFRHEKGPYSEDYDLWIRMAERSPFYMLSDELSVYRRLPSSMLHGNLDKEFRYQLLVIEMHRHRYSRMRYRFRRGILYSDMADSALFDSQEGAWRILAYSLALNPLHARTYTVLLRSLGGRIRRWVQQHLVKTSLP